MPYSTHLDQNHFLMMEIVTWNIPLSNGKTENSLLGVWFWGSVSHFRSRPFVTGSYIYIYGSFWKLDKRGCCLPDEIKIKVKEKVSECSLSSEVVSHWGDLLSGVSLGVLSVLVIVCIIITLVCFEMNNTHMFYTHTHTYIYIYTHTYIYTYIHGSFWKLDQRGCRLPDEIKIKVKETVSLSVVFHQKWSLTGVIFYQESLLKGSLLSAVVSHGRGVSWVVSGVAFYQEQPLSPVFHNIYMCLKTIHSGCLPHLLAPFCGAADPFIAEGSTPGVAPSPVCGDTSMTGPDFDAWSKPEAPASNMGGRRILSSSWLEVISCVELPKNQLDEAH